MSGIVVEYSTIPAGMITAPVGDVGYIATLVREGILLVGLAAVPAEALAAAERMWPAEICAQRSVRGRV